MATTSVSTAIGKRSPAPRRHAPAAFAAESRRWFERRAVVLGAAVFLAAAIFVVRELVSAQAEMIGLLYVIPVALTGLELGVRWGVAAALGTLLLVAVRPPSSDLALDALGLTMRGVALLSVGAIAGRFSDRMREAQLHMNDHFRSAEHILGVHERERRVIAEQLHEQAAQAMAAALLLVGRLEPRALGRLEQAQVQDVRESVRDCIAHLRELAARLRPPVLDELGLVPALERLLESRGQTDGGSIYAASDVLSERLPTDTETLAYRVTEEVVGCMPGTIALRITPGPACLRIDVEAHECASSDAQELEAALATTRARLKIIGGSLSSRIAGERALVAVQIPMFAPRDLGDGRAHPRERSSRPHG